MITTRHYEVVYYRRLNEQRVKCARPWRRCLYCKSAPLDAGRRVHCSAGSDLLLRAEPARRRAARGAHSLSVIAVHRLASAWRHTQVTNDDASDDVAKDQLHGSNCASFRPTLTYLLYLYNQILTLSTLIPTSWNCPRNSYIRMHTSRHLYGAHTKAWIWSAQLPLGGTGNKYRPRSSGVAIRWGR